MKLQINNLSIYFNSKDGTRKILDQVNLELNSGFHLLCGENGSGKSSLLKTIVGIVKPAKGEIVLPSESQVFLNSDLEKYKKFKVLKYFEKLCIKRNFLPSQRFIEDAQSLFEIKDLWNKSIKDLPKEEANIISLLDLVFEDYDVVLLDEVFSSMEINRANKVLSFIYGHYKNRIIILVDHQNRLKIEPNYYLYLKDYSIVLEEKPHSDCFLVNSESIVSKKCALGFVRRKYEELKTSIPLYFITAIFIMVSIILPLVTNHINSSKLKGINYLPCVTLYNPSEELKKSLDNKKQFHLPADAAQKYALETLFNINDNLHMGYNIDFLIDDSLDDCEFKTSIKIENNYTTILPVWDSEDDDIFTFIYYKYPEVKYNYVSSSGDKTIIVVLSLFLFNHFLSSQYFKDRVKLLGLKEKFDYAFFYFNKESKIVTNSNDLKLVELLDKVDGKKQSIELTYDKDIKCELAYDSDKFIAISTGFVLDYFKQKEFKTYYFSSHAEYNDIISKSRNVNIVENYSDFVSKKNQFFKQGLFLYFINYFFFSGIVLITKPKWSKENNLVTLSEVSGVFYAISFAILLICRAFYAALLSLILLLTIALAILHSYKKKKMVGRKNV